MFGQDGHSTIIPSHTFFARSQNRKEGNRAVEFLLEIDSKKKLVAKQFKQKIALKVIGPFKIDWIFRKMCVFLLPLNSGKLNWINAYIEPRIAVYLNHVKWCWFSWLLTKNSFPSLLSLNHIQFPYCTEWLRLEGSHNLTFADDLHRTKKLNCLVPKRIGAEVNPAHSKGC